MARQRVATLVCDFDLSLTTRDTLHLLAATPRRCSPRSSPVPAWKDLVAAYLADYKQLILDPHCSSISDYLHQLLPVDRASINRVSNCFLFRGLSRSDLYKAGQSNVTLHPNSKKVLQTFLQHNGNRVYILSLNWSKDFILGALGGIVDRERVLSNDLEFERNGVGEEVSTGKIVGDVVGGLDKLEVLKRTLGTDHYGCVAGVGDR
ncbi:hypothetical protein HK098_005904 [Nowakowskiella sp. JEL0407]|nr:hypothetical protein HK098_005904 [Nowakowskiella sp. JEL0407]